VKDILFGTVLLKHIKGLHSNSLKVVSQTLR